MECIKCGQVIPNDSEYCPFCGEKVDQKNICRSCGSFLDDGGEFCPYCGKKVYPNVGKLYLKKEKKHSFPDNKRLIRIVGVVLVAVLGVGLLISGKWRVKPNNNADNDQNVTHSDLSNEGTDLKGDYVLPEEGQEVYVEITSITPSYGVYEEGKSFYSHFICEATTKSNKRIWMYVTCQRYKDMFDTSVSSSTRDTNRSTVVFSNPRFIKGVVCMADTIADGVPDEVGAKVLEIISDETKTDLNIKIGG